MKIGEYIAEFRKKQGLTQAELAKFLGVTDKAVSKWERNISCPDISLLPNIAESLRVTIDALLQGKSATNEEVNEKFVSLEKYFMGTYGYIVPDFHPQDEEITLIMDAPDKDDAEHGYALSGRAGAEVNRYIFGAHSPFTLDKMRSGKLGVIYLSNVPLVNIDPPIGKLVDELEYTRLNKYHIDRFLLQACMKKFSNLVLSDSVKVIALTREFNQKYFGAFISYASPEILSIFYDKISSGNLKILYVGVPLFWNKEDYNKPKGLTTLKEYMQQ